MQYDILQFDTKLFGFKVARINPAKLTLIKLQKILEKLRSEKVRLVYWQSDSNDKASQQAAKKLNGSLASKQTTYLIDLKKTKPPEGRATEIIKYRAKTPTPEMNKLALQVGKPSRFGVDPKLPKTLFHKMYYTWIKNSTNHSIADEVLVIKNRNEKVVGMITLSIKNKMGDIGLVAVASRSRGKNFGTKLVYAAQNYFISEGYSKVQVVTQKSNIAACRLYQKCGFKLNKIDNFYHFWL